MLEIDGYHIFAELKRGPVTTIFKALDTRHGRIVLIKLLHAEAASETNRLVQFLQESNITALMLHPNLRHIYQSGMVGDEHFLALEYVEGPTLFELINRHKKLPIDICLFIGKELAKAMAAVHRYNVLHLDVKPHNIFLSFAGDVKLGDLGMARELMDSNPTIVGTPAYMSPEQVFGREITKSSDLFSFGAVLYEMLTGEAAFANRTLSATLHHVANWEPVPIAKLRPEVPSEFVATCQKLLAKNPDERYRDAEAVIEHLTWLEQLYGLTITKHELADFITSPETYRQVDLQQRVAIAEPGLETKSYSRAPTLSWGAAAVVSAAMFLAGVIFISVLKMKVENKTISAASQTAVTVPALLPPQPEEYGYLDLSVKPWGAVSIGPEALGKTPLQRPIPLPVGSHKVRVQHPQWGEKEIEVQISVGDTLRRRLDLTKP
ncbi:MAG: serine/threonine protein kinase [bacterium]